MKRDHRRTLAAPTKSLIPLKSIDQTVTVAADDSSGRSELEWGEEEGLEATVF
jgi:hypothetical protein